MSQNKVLERECLGNMDIDGPCAEVSDLGIHCTDAWHS